MKKITKKDGEVIKLLLDEGLTIKQASSRLKINERTLYRYVKALINEGVLKKGFSSYNLSKGGYSKTHCQNFAKNELRLHNVQVSIKIISKGKKYVPFLGTSNKLSISGVTVLCYFDKIEVYTQDGINFYGQTTDECYAKAIDFFSIIYAKIENRLGIMIEKDQYLNKKWVRQHIAETNNEVAKESNKTGERISDKGEDGKTWLLTDKSLGGNELEFIHPEKAKDDTEAVLKFIRDMRKNPESMTLSEVSKVLLEVVYLQKESAAGMKSIIDVLKLVMPSKPEVSEEQTYDRPNYIG